jgi:hypothetical protein
LSAVAATAQSDPGKPAPLPGNVIVQPPARSFSRIKGRAIYQDSGLPLPAATIRLIDPQRPRPLGGMTADERGNFGFGGLPAGEYFIVVQPADEFVPGVAASSFPLKTGDDAFDAARLEEFTRGFPKVSLDGFNSVQIDVRVPRGFGGVISGQVTGAEAPIANALVHVLHKTDQSWRLVQITKTGKEGMFRVSRLPAGEYLVRAAPFGKSEVVVEDAGELRGAVYFASATDADAAAPVSVFPGQETGSINISLVERKMATVAGSIRIRGGKPLPGVMVRLSGPGLIEHIMNSDDQGRWSFGSVASGKYILVIGPAIVLPPGVNPLSPHARDSLPRFVPRREEVRVTEKDIKDLVIELAEGGRISGSVALDGDIPPPKIISVSVEGNRGDEQGQATTRVNTDGTFNLTGVPLGEVTLRVSIFPLQMYQVKSIQLGGVDLLKQKLNIEENAEITNVQIVVARASRP